MVSYVPWKRSGLRALRLLGKHRRIYQTHKAIPKIQYLPNYPRQKVYKTFEKYAEDYRGYEYNKEEKRYGFYCNPNAMWDWYQIGGRWPVTFLVKADCTEYSFGERSWATTAKIPCSRRIYVGFGSKKKDICWDVMRSWYIAQDTERYTKLKEAFQCGKLPDEFHGEFLENGFFAAASAPMQPVKPWTNTLPA